MITSKKLINNKIMRIEKNLILPITAIICAIIIGSSILGVQNNKQKSIEKQVQWKINQENKILEEEKSEEAEKDLFYSWCLDDADDTYWRYMRLNGTEKEDGSVWAENRFWNTADERKQDAIDNCFDQYKK